MKKKLKLEAQVHTKYWKEPKQGFPQIIRYIQLAGPYISDIQLYDVVFDEKDIELRFPKRNKKILADISDGSRFASPGEGGNPLLYHGGVEGSRA